MVNRFFIRISRNPEQLLAFMVITITYSTIIAILLMASTSCTPQRRLERILKKHPYLLTQKDTVVVTDTVRITIPGTQKDTFFQVKKLIDTVTIVQDRLNVKMWMVHDTVFVDAACDTIRTTVVRTVKVPQHKFVYRKARDGLTVTLLGIIFGLGIFMVFRGYLLGSRIRNRDEVIKEDH